MARRLVDPLSAQQFASAIRALWPHPRLPRLGLAISGGPDSMALAAAFTHLLPAAEKPYLKAFVVDHGMRDGSGSEADAVVRTLEDRLGKYLRAFSRSDQLLTAAQEYRRRS